MAKNRMIRSVFRQVGTDLCIVHAVPEAIGVPDEARVVSSVAGVARVHQYPVQLVPPLTSL